MSSNFGITTNKDIQKWGITIDSIDIKNPYINNPWVYSAIDKMTKNIAAVPRHIYNLESTKKFNNLKRDLPILEQLSIFQRSLRPINTEIDKKSPWYKLFLKPNELMSGSDFFKTLLTLALLPPGDVFILMINANDQPVTNPTEVPTRMFLVPGWEVQEDITEILGGFKLFNGWMYNGNKLKVFQLQQFRLDVNPYNIIRGIDPLTSAMAQYKIDSVTNTFNQKFFEQGAMPSGYLFAETKIDDKIKNEMEDRWTKRFGGAENSGKTPVLSGGIKFIPTTFNHQNMEFTELKKMSREAIFGVYDVPLVEIGITDGSNNSISLSQDYGFWRNNLIPKVRKIEELLELRFFPDTPTFMAFDLSVVEALRKDLTEKQKIARGFWEMGYPINTINERLELGMGQAPNGDIQFVAPGFLPMDLVIEKYEKDIELVEKAIKEPTPKPGSSSPGSSSTDNNAKTKKSLQATKIMHKIRTLILRNTLTSDKLLELRAKFKDEVGNVEIYDLIVKNIPKTDCRDYFNQVNTVLNDL